MELDFSGIIPAIPGLWNGMVMTLQLMVMGVVGGIALGTVLALMRLSASVAYAVSLPAFLSFAAGWNAPAAMPQAWSPPCATRAWPVHC